MPQKEKFDFKIELKYYYDNSNLDFHHIRIETPDGFSTTHPERWSEGQRMNMIRNFIKALKMEDKAYVGYR